MKRCAKYKFQISFKHDLKTIQSLNKFLDLADDISFSISTSKAGIQTSAIKVLIRLSTCVFQPLVMSIRPGLLILPHTMTFIIHYSHNLQPLRPQLYCVVVLFHLLLFFLLLLQRLLTQKVH